MSFATIKPHLSRTEKGVFYLVLSVREGKSSGCWMTQPRKVEASSWDDAWEKARECARNLAAKLC